VIGGTSWHSTVVYYRYLNQSINDLYGSETNPPILLFNLNQQETSYAAIAGRWDQIASIYSEAALKLRLGGAQAVLFAANTPYRVVGSRSEFLDRN
jgi:aspartate/glutamate racemase